MAREYDLSMAAASIYRLVETNCIECRTARNMQIMEHMS